MNIKWLKGEIDEEHCVGHKRNEMEADDSWIKLLVDISRYAKMLTTDSQMGVCDTSYTIAHPSFIEYAKKRKPELTIDLNTMCVEYQRPYIEGFVKPRMTRRIIEEIHTEHDLILFWCTDGEKRWNCSELGVERYNLTLISFENLQTLYNTNVTINVPIGESSFYLGTRIHGTLTCVVIASKYYGRTKEYKESIKRLINKCLW